MGEEKLSEDIDQLFELTKIIVLVLAGLIPNLTENKLQGKLPLIPKNKPPSYLHLLTLFSLPRSFRGSCYPAHSFPSLSG